MRQVSIIVEEFVNIWGYRAHVRVLAEGRGVAVAAFDEWGNCLGGSCREVEEVLEALDGCRKLFSEKMEEYDTGAVRGVRYRMVYECPGS